MGRASKLETISATTHPYDQTLELRNTIQAAWKTPPGKSTFGETSQNSLSSSIDALVVEGPNKQLRSAVPAHAYILRESPWWVIPEAAPSNETKVTEFCSSILVQENVAWFDVAMNQASGM